MRGLWTTGRPMLHHHARVRAVHRQLLLRPRLASLLRERQCDTDWTAWRWVHDVVRGPERGVLQQRHGRLLLCVRELG
jgi:hypothetical protein